VRSASVSGQIWDTATEKRPQRPTLYNSEAIDTVTYQ
jgi:hypothetical protein